MDLLILSFVFTRFATFSCPSSSPNFFRFRQLSARLGVAGTNSDSSKMFAYIGYLPALLIAEQSAFCMLVTIASQFIGALFRGSVRFVTLRFVPAIIRCIAFNLLVHETFRALMGLRPNLALTATLIYAKVAK